jgi:hypothetical protein
MRTLATFLLFILCVVQTIGQSSKTFNVTIDESVMLGTSKTIITQDSIIVTSKYQLNETKTMGFRKALTKDEKLKLEQLISKINLDKLKDKYHNDFIDDHYEFKFTFDVNDKIKVMTIYGVRLKDIFNFVRQINNMIPKDFEIIHYNDEYLKLFETNER